MSWFAFLLAYIVGGITFIPLVVAAVLTHAYLTFPNRDDARQKNDAAGDGNLVQPGDDVDGLKAAQKDDTKSPRTNHHDPDVAAGYFAVCREYTPMGINAKPIERSTPVGSATVAAPSPSVYQTMYRSIFDRKPGPGPLDSKTSGSQRPKKAGNVFYVVLRHGHLMLFDDDEQLEVRHVVSLAHHDVSIYSGEANMPEGELFIKRNAICLSRKTDGAELGPDTQLSKPFFLFSENCSAKEDFYFALLRNQEQSFAAGSKPPSPLGFDVKNIISLVQKLHSSEEHMQTRWLNAIIGRVFLGVHKTKDMENFIREKLTKKISRVKRPAFLSNIAIKAIDTGESAPYITNPRLRDLTVEGECGVEADVRYTGNFRIEVAATARIDLGSRFKAREVNLVLAVVVRKLEGHMLFKIKPPPSDRLWFSFQQAPKIEMTIEPIVSTRQITYTVILRQIENRIKEVITETLVLPFWDDMPFFNTEQKKWRGGIFHDDKVDTSVDLETAVAQDGNLDEVDRLEENHAIQESDVPSREKSHSVPVLEKRASTGLFSRLSTKTRPDHASFHSASSTSIDIKSERRAESKTDTVVSPPIFSGSFVQPSTPTVETDTIHADLFKPSSSPPNESPAASAMASISAKSLSSSPAQTPGLNPFRPYITSKSSSQSSASSREAIDTDDVDRTPQPRRSTASSTESREDSGAKSPTLSARGSVRGHTESHTHRKGLFVHHDTSPNPSPVGSPGPNDLQKRTALAAVTNAAASTVKRWGLNALQRRNNEGGLIKNSPPIGNESPVDLNQPMGRGQPLPPPGMPLPMPNKKSQTAPVPVPKRKPVPPPSPNYQDEEADHKVERRPVPPPPLPKRRQLRSEQPDEDNMLVVAAPADSEPTTPLSASHSPSYIQPWVEDMEDNGLDAPTGEGGVTALGLVNPKSSLRVHNPQQEEEDQEFQAQELSAGDDDEYSAWMDGLEPESEEPEGEDTGHPNP
ncbi:hypothetical protein B0T24DRAFT_712703 [Lasiosphaeria ovina]|uniref:SMP-LTD domain-containing protein n=1 Tax=Lasiosphaeria ovina TaxID=92902 RepID=A0AAE0JW33_9PEZI|nr:hypothetical protein B0T24DRAFT_712703 [Lasiosphaeria ovina]